MEGHFTKFKELHKPLPFPSHLSLSAAFGAASCFCWQKNQHFNSGGDTTQLLGHFPLPFVPSPASKSSVGSSWCDWLEENLYEFSVGKYCALRTVVQGGPEKSKPLPNHQKIVLNEIRFIRQW